MQSLRLTNELYRAALQGIKTVTRRPLAEQPREAMGVIKTDGHFYQQGIYARGFFLEDEVTPKYRVGEEVLLTNTETQEQTAARITYIRCSRLLPITNEEAVDEGFPWVPDPAYTLTPAQEFMHCWNQLYEDKFPGNPWVWVYRFELIP